MNKTKKLFEQRAEKMEKLQKLYETVEGEQRAITEEEQKEIDTLEKEIRSIDATVKALNKAKDILGTKEKESEKAERAEVEEKQFADYILGKAAELRGGEQNVTMGNNGAIIPTTIADRIIKAVKDKCPILAGATMYSVKGVLKVPVWGDADSHNIKVGYQTEFTELTADSGKFTSVDLGGYLAGALTLIGKSVENNAAFSVVDFIVNQMAEEIAIWIEANNSAEAANALAGAAAASSTDVQPLTEALAQCSAGAKNAGWSVQETTAVLGKFADAGITGSDAGTSLKTMLQRLSAPTDKAATMIENLGIQTRDSNGNMLGASEMAEELQSKLGGLDAATRDAALQTIFGSDAMRAAIILTSSGAEGLEKYEKATNDQEAAQRMANSQMGEGSRAIEELKGSLETASIIVGDTLAPIIQKVAEFITDLVNKFTSLPQGMQTTIIAIAGIVAAVGPLLILIGKMSLGVSAVAKAFSKMTAVGKAVVSIFNFIKGAATSLFGVIAAHPVIAVITAIVAALVMLYQKCEWFRDGVHAVIDTISGFFKNLGKSIIEMKDKAVEAFGNMVEGAKNKASEIDKAVREGFQSAIDFITSLPGKAVEWGSDFIDGLAKGIKKTTDKVIDAVKSLAKKVTSFLHFSRPDEGPLREYEKWMPDFMEGMSKGIYDNAYKVTDAVKSLSQSMSNNLSMGNSILELAANQNVNVNNAVTVQVGNRQFDSYIVKTVNDSAGKRHLSNMRAKGCLK